jgi:nicotinamidase-related amidase
MAALDLGGESLRAAVVTIDLHRGHLDPAVATMPLPAEHAAAVTAANVRFLGAARRSGLPVVHLVTSYRDVGEIESNRFWRGLAGTGATRGTAREHQLAGGPGQELMPGVCVPEHDRVIATKKRYDCFRATDLGLVLDSLGINTVVLTGVNTNSCVLATAAAACSRDYAVIVVADCVDTMDGPEWHDAALRCIERAFGWVMGSTEVLEAIDG